MLHKGIFRINHLEYPLVLLRKNTHKHNIL